MIGEGDGPSAEEAEVDRELFEGPPEPPAPTPVATGPAWQRYAALAPEYLALADFGAMPRTKAGWALRVVVTLVAVLFLERQVVTATRTLMTAKPPPGFSAQEIDDYRFRLPERTRREIFHDLATAEIAERNRAIQANTWGGHLWSREDDRGHYERVAARGAAAKYKVSLSQVYLVLDEGIREKWPGPDGQPLKATTPALNIRSNSW